MVTIIEIFLLAAIWYFFPVGRDGFPSLLFAMRLALPALVLTLGGIGLIPRTMVIGFAFCTIGDAFGVMKCFEAQMGGFAIAQLCFISRFLREILMSDRRFTKRNDSHNLPWIIIWLCTPSLFPVINKIISAVPGWPLRIGCSIYAILLFTSALLAIVRTSYTGRFVAMIGSIFFLISDFILAWNKFVNHIPHASIFIMSTYYAALLLIFCGTTYSRFAFTDRRF